MAGRRWNLGAGGVLLWDMAQEEPVSRHLAPLLLVLVLAAPLPGCDDFKSRPATPAAAARVVTPGPAPASAPASPLPTLAPTVVAEDPVPAPPAGAAASASAPEPSANPQAQALESATFAPGQGPAQRRALLFKVEVLLDRARFSPGVIDGRPGSNLRKALAAFESARNLPGQGAVDAAAVDALAGADRAPVTSDYVLNAEDEKGPFIGQLPATMAEQAGLAHLGYRDVVQLLAERFHMDEALLRALNPGVDFTVPGVRILVAAVDPAPAAPPVARVEVDKSAGQVRAFDSAGALVAVLPATVGSVERPAPSGTFKVTSVVANPDYTYNPRRLTFGDRSSGPMTLRPGPNNPVGATWIGIDAPTYGLHGSPDPALVGKTASHGCVRLTNWDAAWLGRGVKKGVPVVFVGQSRKA